LTACRKQIRDDNLNLDFSRKLDTFDCETYIGKYLLEEFNAGDVREMLRTETNERENRNAIMLILEPLIVDLSSKEIYPSDIEILLNSQTTMELILDKFPCKDTVEINLTILDILKLLIKVISKEHESETSISPENCTLSIFCFENNRIMSDDLAHKYQSLITSLSYKIRLKILNNKYFMENNNYKRLYNRFNQ
jgi:hypothetical protein